MRILHKTNYMEKKVVVIESITKPGVEWVISLTDHNPNDEDCFLVEDKTEAFRVKKMLEDWGNNNKS